MDHFSRVEPGHHSSQATYRRMIASVGPGPGSAVLLLLLALALPAVFILGGAMAGERLGHDHEGSLLTLVDHSYRHLHTEGSKVRLAYVSPRDARGPS